MSNNKEFKEIAHGGGKITFIFKDDPERGLTYRIQWSHSRATPTSLFTVYAIPQGVAVGDLITYGMGAPFSAPPIIDCYPVFIGSDSTGMFGIVAQFAKDIGDRIILERYVPTVHLEVNNILSS